MSVGKILRLGIALTFATAALADQPRAVPPPTVCSLSGTVCATRGSGAVTVWRKLASARKKTLWRAPSRGTSFQVADDGRSLVEIQPLANLVERDAGPDTVMFIFHRPDGPPTSVRLGQMIRNLARLPQTVSHRSWATTFGYDGRGHFQVDTVEGRRILFDPTSGKPIPR